jgi:hypothetical protein
MVVKFFPNKGGGGVGAINYLLDKQRVALEQAKLLQGNEKLTRKLIELIDNKQKLTVGCLSFSEEDIDEDLKFKLMDEFEKILLAGLKPEQYNILWVEHTDKGRLELNFAIPKLELTSKKALQPYYHKSDLARVEMWQDITNLKYGFSNPKDPQNQRNVNTSKVEISKTKSYEALDRTLHKFVQEGKIKNRDELIDALEYNKMKVTRKSDNYISIKLPNSKKARRFKGDIYTSRFTSLESINIMQIEKEIKIENFQNMDVKSEIEELSFRLEKYVEDKAIKNKNKYPYTPELKKELEDIKMHYMGGQDDSIGEETIGRVRAERSLRQDTYREITDSYAESLDGFRETRRDVEDEFSKNADNLATKDDGSTGELRELFERVVSKIGERVGRIVEQTVKPFIAVKAKDKGEDTDECLKELEVDEDEPRDDLEGKTLLEGEKMLVGEDEQVGNSEEDIEKPEVQEVMSKRKVRKSR